MKHFESLESTQPKLQGGRPSPETPRGSQSDLRVLAWVNDVESVIISCETTHNIFRPLANSLLDKYPSDNPNPRWNYATDKNV